MTPRGDRSSRVYNRLVPENRITLFTKNNYYRLFTVFAQSHKKPYNCKTDRIHFNVVYSKICRSPQSRCRYALKTENQKHDLRFPISQHRIARDETPTYNAASSASSFPPLRSRLLYPPTVRHTRRPLPRPGVHPAVTPYRPVPVPTATSSTPPPQLVPVLCYHFSISGDNFRRPPIHRFPRVRSIEPCFPLLPPLFLLVS